ncbi:MAG: tRNA pseudouridine(55) synthase TruB [Bacteroidota bacterium]
MWHGFLIINKERGLTSHQVIAKLRRILKQTEIGHTGTLDPDAEGVLVVGLGQATRSFSFLDESVKVYQAEIILGQRTDTQDASGKVVMEHLETNLSIDAIQETIAEFIGNIRQKPPMYSAVKLHGQRLYDLARQGITVERNERPITVHSWTIENPKSRFRFRERFISKIICSKGTYIRTLIDDLGNKLGCGAHMGSLLRIQSGNFRLDNAVTVEKVSECVNNGCVEELIIPISKVLSHLPSIYPDDSDLQKVKNGGKLSLNKYSEVNIIGSIVKAVEKGTEKTVAILNLKDNGSYQFWQPVKVFRYD